MTDLLPALLRLVLPGLLGCGVTWYLTRRYYLAAFERNREIIHELLKQPLPYK